MSLAATSPFIRWLPPVLWGLVIFVLSLMPGGQGNMLLFGIPHFDKVGHFGMYAIWAFLIFMALCGYPPEDLLLREDFYVACTRELDVLAAALPDTPTGVRFAGDPDRQISTVAVVGGSGAGELASASAVADVLVTSDIGTPHGHASDA